MSDVVDIDAVFSDPSKRMTPGGDPRMSIMDFVMYVTGRSKKHAKKHAKTTIDNLKPENGAFFQGLEKYQFPGRGERNQYVLTHSEATGLAMILPGKRAKAFQKAAGVVLSRVHEGDPTLQDVITKNALINNPMEILLEHVEEIVASVPLEKGGESEAHYECKNWVLANLNCLSFATAMCPTCSTPALGVAAKGGVAATEQTIPGTNYRGDVVVRLEGDTYVVIEVKHTHPLHVQKLFECNQAGNIVYEVTTKEIQRAISEQQPFSNHVLHTTCMESIVCRMCE
jgi:hypothetical protein